MPITIDMQQLENRYAAAYPRPAPAPEPEQPTFAQRILRDIPARMAAARAKLLAGDAAGGKADLDYVGSWIDENQGALEEFSNYTGTNRLARTVSDKSLSLLSRDELTQLMPLTDPAANERSVDFEASRNGWGPEMTGVARKARYEKDPYALAMLSQFGRPAPQAPRRAGQAAAPDADPAARFEAQIKYTKTFAARVSPAVRLDADEMVGLAKIGFDAGDMEAGTRLAELASAAARESGLDDLGRANVFKSTLRASADAMRAWGAADELQTAQGAEVLAALTADTGGLKDMSGRRQQLSQVMRQTSQWLAQRREIGVDAGAKAASIARVLYRRQFNGAAPDTEEDRPVSEAMTRMGALAGKIRNNRMLTGDPLLTAARPAGAQPAGAPPAEPPGDGFSLFERAVKRHIEASGAAAIANGTEVDREIENRAEDLARGLVELGVPDIGQARAAAAVLSQLLVKGEELDIRRVPEIIEASEANRAAVGAGVEKRVLQAADKPAAAPEFPGVASRVKDEAYRRALAAQPKVDPATGQAIPEETRQRNADTEASASVDVRLYDQFMKMDISNRDLLGVGDRNVTERGFQAAVAPVVPQIFFEQSPMFKLLYEKTKVADLDKPATREAAIQAVESAYAEKANLAYRMSADASNLGGVSPLRVLAAGQVDRVIGNIKRRLSREGTDPALTPAQHLPDTPAEVEALGRGMLAPPPVGVPYGGYEAADREVAKAPADLARDLAQVFVDRLGVPEGERGVGIRARARMLSLAAMPEKPADDGKAAAKAAPPSAKGVDLNLVRTNPPVAAEGYDALVALTKSLNEPIKDRIVAKYVESDLGEKLTDSKIPRHRADQIVAEARRFARAGTPLEELERMTWNALAKLEEERTAEALRVYRAKKVIDAEFKPKDGLTALGGQAEVDETQPSTR